MKAYQLKIALKNSKPPIWRRCIIPSGITFSQLSLLLNQIMGWNGSHLSKFDFFHSKIELLEDDGFGCFDEPWDYDVFDSSKIYINEFMEDEKWFTYVYDFGDEWTHRVTIENVIEDYDFNYAKVLKYKGDCPPDDIGGIDMYHILLDGDFEKITGIPAEEIPLETYDVDSVNESLRKDYFVKWTKKGESRIALDIFEDVFTGKGLTGCTNPVNKYEMYGQFDDEEMYNMHRLSDECEIDDINATMKHQGLFSEKKSDDMLRFIDMMINFGKYGSEEIQEIYDEVKDEMDDVEFEEFENRLKGLNEKVTESPNVLETMMEFQNTMTKIAEFQNNSAKMIDDWFDEQNKYKKLKYRLLNFTKEELTNIGKKHGIVLKQSWNKEKMTQVLSEKILVSEDFTKNISRLDEAEIKAFEKAIKHNGMKIDENEAILYVELYEFCYVLLTLDNEVIVPLDIIDLYKSINTKEFKKNRKYYNWINKCTVYLQYYYGCAPMSIMLKLVNEKEGIRLNESKLREKLAYFTDKVTVVDDFIVVNELMDDEDYEQFMEWQGKDKSYYIPSVEEIEYFYDCLVYLPSEYDKEMARFLESLCGDLEHAVFAATIIQRKVYNEEDLQDVINLLEDEEISFRNEKDIEKFISIYNNLWNNTRLLANKGHTPQEILREMPVSTSETPTIIPVSSEAAKLLDGCKAELEGRGIKVDLDSNAKNISVMDITSNGETVRKREKKVYPNDLCPCGSGKKFKKCCGR